MNNTTVNIGDIFCMSWGYDQTNVDFFQVTRVTPKGVEVREIGMEQVPGTEGFMCCNVRPTPNKFLTHSSWVKDNTTGVVRKLGVYDGKPFISFGSRYIANRVSPTYETYNSWYA